MTTTSRRPQIMMCHTFDMFACTDLLKMCVRGYKFGTTLVELCAAHLYIKYKYEQQAFAVAWCALLHFCTLQPVVKTCSLQSASTLLRSAQSAQSAQSANH